VTTYAGSGAAGIADGPVAQAQFIAPFGVAWGPGRRLYVTDAAAQRIRRRVAGRDRKDGRRLGRRRADGARRSRAATPTVRVRRRGSDLPTGIVVDADGRVLVTDTGNRCIRRSTRTDAVTTLAGRSVRGAGGAR